jgi:hypothetical protein
LRQGLASVDAGVLAIHKCVLSIGGGPTPVDRGLGSVKRGLLSIDGGEIAIGGRLRTHLHCISDG